VPHHVQSKVTSAQRTPKEEHQTNEQQIVDWCEEMTSPRLPYASLARDVRREQSVQEINGEYIYGSMR
jgi:hypothetical protein